MLADTKARWGPRRAASLSAATSSDSCAYVRSCRSDMGMTNGRPGTRAARLPILGGRFGDAGVLERAGRIQVHHRDVAGNLEAKWLEQDLLPRRREVAPEA